MQVFQTSNHLGASTVPSPCRPCPSCTGDSHTGRDPPPVVSQMPDEGEGSRPWTCCCTFASPAQSSPMGTGLEFTPNGFGFGKEVPSLWEFKEQSVWVGSFVTDHRCRSMHTNRDSENHKTALDSLEGEETSAFSLVAWTTILPCPCCLVYGDFTSLEQDRKTRSPASTWGTRNVNVTSGTGRMVSTRMSLAVGCRIIHSTAGAVHLWHTKTWLL